MRLLQAFVGVLFLFAGLAKLRLLADFTEIVRQHSWARRLLTPRLSALIVVSSEIVLGVGLITGVAERASALVALALLTVLTAVISIPLIGGKGAAKCGCMVPIRGDALNWTIYPRNLGLGLWLMPRVEATMKGGLVGGSMQSLREAWFGENTSRMVAIQYESLAKRPAEVMKALYTIIGEPQFSHRFDDLEYDQPEFDARLNLPGLHRVSRRVAYVARQTILPPDLFGQLDACFWNEPGQNPCNIIVL